MALSSGLGQRAGSRCPTRSTNASSARNVRVQSVFSAKGAAQEARVVGREWLETILSRFGPATDRAQNITTLDFEKPLLELDKRIKEVGVMCSIVSHLSPFWLRDSPLNLHHAPAGSQGCRGEWRRRQHTDC